jgi:hypothetical protein
MMRITYGNSVMTDYYRMYESGAATYTGFYGPGTTAPAQKMGSS